MGAYFSQSQISAYTRFKYFVRKCCPYYSVLDQKPADGCWLQTRLSNNLWENPVMNTQPVVLMSQRGYLTHCEVVGRTAKWLDFLCRGLPISFQCQINLGLQKGWARPLAPPFRRLRTNVLMLLAHFIHSKCKIGCSWEEVSTESVTWWKATTRIGTVLNNRSVHCLQYFIALVSSGLTVIVSPGRVLIQEEAALAVLLWAERERRGWTGWYQRLLPPRRRQNLWSDFKRDQKTKLDSRWISTVHVNWSGVAVTLPSNPVSLNKILFWLKEYYCFFIGNKVTFDYLFDCKVLKLNLYSTRLGWNANFIT